MIRRLHPALLFSATAGLVVGVAIIAAWLPQALFAAGTPLVDMAPSGDAAQFVGASVEIRIALAEQYFSWSIYSLTLCGVIVWKFALRRLGLYIQLLLAAATLCSTVAFIFGSGYLELVALAMGAGINVLSGGNHIDAYPSIQFLATAAGFLFAATAAIACVITDPLQGDEP